MSTDTDTTQLDEKVVDETPAEEQPTKVAPGEVVETNPDARATDVPAPTVTAQDPKVVGDDDLEAREVTAGTVQQKVAAQVTQPREAEPDTVDVHEVAVATDTVILDTSDPLAVQVPEAGRSPLLSSGLPISKLDAERVEDVFAREAGESKTISDSERASAASEGRTARSDA